MASQKESPSGLSFISYHCMKDKNILLCTGQSAIVSNFMGQLNASHDSATINSAAGLYTGTLKPDNTLNIPAC